MLPTSCAIRIEIDRLRCEADIALGELVDLPFEGHGGRGRQRAVCGEAGKQNMAVGPSMGDRLAGVARWVQLSLLSFAGWKRAPAVGGRLPCVPFNEASHSLKPNICVPARLGKALILIFVLVFGGWGYFAPLDGGAVAPGVINPDSGKKTIQHLEGGIIAEMRVREGETVTIGQPLVVLESTQARAAHESLVQQRWSLLARKARLDAESAERNRIEWPPELLSAGRQIRSIVEAQQEVFDARRLTHATKKSVLGQRLEQLTQKIQGNPAKVESTSPHIVFIYEEFQAKE